MLGAGVAACAVCCAPPILARLGIAGAGAIATVATIAFAGLAFGLVVIVALVGALGARWRRASQGRDCATVPSGPVEVAIGDPGPFLRDKPL